MEEQDIRAGSAIGLTPELEGQIKQGASQAQSALGQAGGQAQQQTGQGLEQGGREAAKRAGGHEGRVYHDVLHYSSGPHGHLPAVSWLSQCCYTGRHSAGLCMCAVDL